MEPAKKSFIEVEPDCHFPIQNLPYGIFTHPRSSQPRVGVAIGNLILDLAELEQYGILEGYSDGPSIFSRNNLNGLMQTGRATWTRLRKRITELLSVHCPEIRDQQKIKASVFHAQSECEMLLPVSVPDYTDFYSSRDHATNVGTMLRGADNALQPNWLQLPVAYHGRSSSLIPSGINIQRPLGQLAEKSFGPSRAIDFELEMGFFIGKETNLGEEIEIGQTPHHIFGMVLVNDWSARDIQKWEYVPLGPFLAKSFATSISPWVVTTDALAPFQRPLPTQDPPVLPYLRWSADYSYDIDLRVSLTPATMDESVEITRSNFQNLYWSMHQQLAHHTVNGCNVRVGDLLASGTISGPEKNSRGCLLELSWRGAEPLELPGGGKRIFLEDGDRVTMTGWCQGADYRVGFGELTNKLLPSRKDR
ncbi:MAG: fumarylacetoacetase [Planctomycetaceae bacterium]|nr:fumarylacetoacetase [Planctomycetaceae bacterium]